jgi:succinate dehydrogenase / fumarate reductase cytochrome b subunit
MNLLNLLFRSSAGKKILMAISGFCLVLFLVAHLAGNLTAFAGADAFNGYAEKLHSLGPFLILFNIGLAAVSLIHIILGGILFLENLRARPHGYRKFKNPGGRTFGSDTMPYTGFLILVFVIYHLFKFTFVDKSGTMIYTLVSETFSMPLNIFVYTAAMIIVALHVSHGIWSLFQTLGASNDDAMPMIHGLSQVTAVAFAIGFAGLPIYLFFIN